MTGSLRTRVTVVGVVTLALVLGLGAWVTVRALGAALRADIEGQNDDVLDALAGAIDDGADVATLRLPLGADGTEFLILDELDRPINVSVIPFVPSDDQMAELLANQPGLSVFESGVVVGSGLIVDTTGVVTNGSQLPPGLPPGAIVEVFEIPIGDGHFVDADDWFETRRSVVTPEGQEVTLVALSPLGLIGRSVDRLAATMALIVPLLILAGGVALWWAVGAALAPVGRITEEANRIAPSNSGDRLPVPASKDEIAELAETLNGMLDRLDAGLVRQRQFVSDASHELRSPLTAVRGAAGLLTDRTDLPSGSEPAVAALARGTARLEAVLDDLTDLASSGAASPRQEIDLADVVLEEVAAVRSAAGSGSQVVVGTDRIEAVVIVANPVQLGRAVNNVLSNAVRHAAARVEVVVRPTDAGIEIVVDDDGPGVPPAEQDRIFERFIRLDDDRSRATGGSGLGLAIVASVVADHGGTVACRPSPLGGARFVIDLPGTGSSS